ncbi:hypothetical protein DEO72_LG2g2489 [Vigna unguiculata]|uniref:Uncharacterized protein n=1 Tax=Vigna unguiculata TaxID=3917 RepID=A0A4D6KZG6_VIGUN|nr:hypothetical protein DEO72_LG2g2489 [Vigna unguiculata]
MNSPTRLQAREFGGAYRVLSEPTDPAPKSSLLTIQLGQCLWERIVVKSLQKCLIVVKVE